MPIYEYNGKRYNIPEAKAQELTARMPGAKLINEAPYYLADNPSPQPPSRAQINVDVPEVNQTTFDGEIARQTAGNQIGGGVSVGQKQNIADITGDMYGNRELTLPDHKNAAQEQEGFWATGLGDALEKLGAGAVRTIAGFGQVGKQSESTMVPGEKIEGDKNKRSEALQGWFGAANTLSERGDRFGVISDPETGETRKKTYADLWEEGKPLAAAGEALLTATESVPTSIMAMLPGGLPLIAVTSAGQKYNEIANNPDTKDIPEWKKVLNASFSGAIEGLTERLGAKVDMKVFEPVLKKMGEQTVKGILKKGGIGALIQTITEGGEEVISQLGGNVVDYATGVSDEYKPFEGVQDSFVYGAAGGAQFGGVTGAGTIYRAVEQHKANVETAKVQNTLRLWESINKKQSQALPALNNEKQQLEAELGDLTTLSYEEVLNSPESTPELIQARERYDIVNAEYEGVMENLKREVDDFIAPQVQAIQDVATADGMITELNVGTEEAPDIVYLAGGNIAINEDGTIDPAGTAPLLTVKNSEGKKKRLISRKKIVTAQQDDLDATIEGIKQRAYEKFVRPLADKLEGKTHFQDGEQVEYVNAKGETVAGTVTAKQNNTVTVVGIDGKKTETFTEDELAQRLIGETIDDIRTRDVIQVELNGQVYDADVTNIQDGIAELHIPSFPEAAGRYQDVTAAELRRMRVMPQVEGQEQVQEGIKKTDETPENEGSATGRTVQSVSETGEPQAESHITPEQQQEQFIASLPKTKEGDIDYDKIEDDDTFITALKSEFPEDAAEIVEEYRKQAQKRLSDADRVQDPVKKKRAQRAAQAQVDRFSNMYERLNPKAQYQARVAGLEEGTIREREAKMGEYLSLRDYLLRNIATGKHKFRWNKNDTDKGLGGELFATKNQETERKKRISFLNNNGYSPESLAELIAESAGQGSEINPGWFSDASQIRDEIIDILLSHDTPTSMIDAATELRKQPETYEEYMENFVDPAVIFEYEANDASQDAMLNSLATPVLHSEMSDEEVKIYFGQHISEEEYNNFIYDINNYLNNINFEQNRTQDGIHRNERTRTGGDRTDVGQITGTEKSSR